MEERRSVVLKPARRCQKLFPSRNPKRPNPRESLNYSFEWGPQHLDLVANHFLMNVEAGGVGAATVKTCSRKAICHIRGMPNRTNERREPERRDSQEERHRKKKKETHSFVRYFTTAALLSSSKHIPFVVRPVHVCTRISIHTIPAAGCQSESLRP